MRKPMKAFLQSVNGYKCIKKIFEWVLNVYVFSGS